MGNVRPAVLDLLLLDRQRLVQYMALALDSEAERLNEGCKETDGDADRNRDAGVARPDRHERGWDREAWSLSRRLSIRLDTPLVAHFHSGNAPLACDDHSP